MYNPAKYFSLPQFKLPTFLKELDQTSGARVRWYVRLKSLKIHKLRKMLEMSIFLTHVQNLILQEYCLSYVSLPEFHFALGVVFFTSNEIT